MTETGGVLPSLVRVGLAAALRLQPDFARRPDPVRVGHLVVPLAGVDPALVYGEVQVQSGGVTRRSHPSDPLSGLDPVTLLTRTEPLARC